MLKSRIITAALLLPVVLALLYFLPPIAFSILIWVMVVLAGFEWIKLAEINNKILSGVFLLLLLAACVVTSNIVSLDWFLMCVAVWWVFVLFLLWQYPRQLLPPSFRAVTAFLVLVPFSASIIYARIAFGFSYVLYPLMLVWAADSGAYFAGKRFGKHKLAPAISPKKTLEGVMGALLASLVIAVIFVPVFHVPLSKWVEWFLLAVVVALFSIVGDLYESMLKRIANVKDSGQLLPGHGGLLDRIDSLTAALPMFMLALLWIN